VGYGGADVNVDGKPVALLMLRSARARSRGVTTLCGRRRHAGRRQKLQKGLADLRGSYSAVLPTGPDHVGSPPVASTPNPDEADIDARCGNMPMPAHMCGFAPPQGRRLRSVRVGGIWQREKISGGLPRASVDGRSGGRVLLDSISRCAR